MSAPPSKSAFNPNAKAFTFNPSSAGFTPSWMPAAPVASPTPVPLPGTTSVSTSNTTSTTKASATSTSSTPAAASSSPVKAVKEVTSALKDAALSPVKKDVPSNKAVEAEEKDIEDMNDEELEMFIKKQEALGIKDDDEEVEEEEEAPVANAAKNEDVIETPVKKPGMKASITIHYITYIYVYILHVFVSVIYASLILYPSHGNVLS